MRARFWWMAYMVLVTAANWCNARYVDEVNR